MKRDWYDYMHGIQVSETVVDKHTEAKVKAYRTGLIKLGHYQFVEADIKRMAEKGWEVVDITDKSVGGGVSLAVGLLKLPFRGSKAFNSDVTFVTYSRSKENKWNKLITKE